MDVILDKKIAIVTGASSGIGQEFVKQLNDCTKTLDEIWVIARRREKLEELRIQLKNSIIKVLPLDLCEETDIEVFRSLLQLEQPRVRILINAAGMGKVGYFENVLEEDIEKMVKLNNMVLTTVTKIVLPYMKAKANVIQMSSASAFFPQKDFAVYAASKAFVLSFSRALHTELKSKGIIVTAVCPGPVNTEFLTIANDGKKQKALKRLVTVSPKVVVERALRDAKAGKDISVYGLPMKTVHVLSKIVPQRIVIH